MIDTKENKILLANIVDKYKKHLKTGENVASNFLNSEKLKMVTKYLDYQKIPYSIYEPYPFLEKKIIYFGEYQDFITFYQVPISKNITHSHILGTLFSLGLDDSLIGDIFVEDGYFYYTNLTKMNFFLEQHFVKIRQDVITLKKVEEIVLVKKHSELLTILVSSQRLDNIVSKLSSKSRSQVNHMILDHFILLNYQEIKSPSMILKEGDILSIRKIGKFKIGKSVGFTKKNNIILEIEKYV